MIHLLQVLRAAAASLVLLSAVSGAAAAPTPLSDELIASLQSAYARAVTPGELADRHRELLAAVLRRVERSHATDMDFAALSAAAAKVLDPLPAGTGDPAEVFRRMMNTALRSLDPYARYMDAKTYAAERAELNGSFVGLGLQLENADGGVRVVASMEGSPAARAGMRAGDFIVQIDGQPLQGLGLSDAIARMRGEAGTTVALTLRRDGSGNDIQLSVTRDIIRRQLLRWTMQGDTLVLRLSSFSGPVGAALADAVAEASALRAPQSMVLDLRGNPGGLVREAVRIADSFLTHGEITSIKGRATASHRNWEADAAELLPGVPMVVLMDKDSASASELVAAALQENGRATVMGQRSYGKGSVQTTYTLGEGQGALKITSALYYGPTGHTVNKTGVVPDVVLLEPAAATQPTRQATAAATVAQSQCAAATGIQGVTDAALACALNFLRIGGSPSVFAATFADFTPY